MDQTISYNDITYANRALPLSHRCLIQFVESVTGKLTLKKLARQWIDDGQKDQNFWKSVLDRLKITVDVSACDIAKIPAKGPTIIVANHPHGLVDGFVLAYLTSLRRRDYKLMVRAFLAKLAFMEDHLIPIQFPYEDNSARKNITARNAALNVVKDGGCVCLFPAGGVATSETYMGPILEPNWTPFLAKMALESDATIIPIYFPGGNSRAFQIANQISPVLRQALLLSEIVKTMGKSFLPVIGDPIKPSDLTSYKNDRNAVASMLRDRTLKLEKKK